MGGKTIGISYQDMLVDLTHNFTKTAPNLTDGETEKVLRVLRQTRMPANYIQNKKLHNKYKELLEAPVQKQPFRGVPVKRLQQDISSYRKRKRDYL